jgi:hypothetical protein
MKTNYVPSLAVKAKMSELADAQLTRISMIPLKLSMMGEQGHWSPKNRTYLGR